LKTVDLWLLRRNNPPFGGPQKGGSSAKSEHEWFESEDYTKVKGEIRWKDWKEENLVRYQDLLIDRYAKEDFYLIAIAPRSKRPINKWKLEENRLDGEEAKGLLAKGYNLAVVCGNRSGGLVVIDIDHTDLMNPFDKMIKKTLTTRSARGYHIYLRCSSESELDSLRELSEKRNSEVRYEDQFTLIPLSIHPSSTKESLKFYDFINWKCQIRHVSQLI
jgi:hypothetical protein